MEPKELKLGLVNALESISEDIAPATSAYALVETDDPLRPFEMRWVHRVGDQSDADRLVDRRLFDAAFADYGFRELRDADNLEGIVYRDLLEKYDDPACIGVKPVRFFDDDLGDVRMVHGADEDDDDAQSARFLAFLDVVHGQVLDGAPPSVLAVDELRQVRGLVYRYDVDAGLGGPIVAFQRTQPMWIQEQSTLLLLSRTAEPEMYADRSLKVGNSFDFVVFDGHVAFRNVKPLENLFGYRKLVVERAREYADALDALIADYEKLEECLSSNRGVANRLLKIQKDRSPVADMEPEDLEYRVKRIAYYSGKFDFDPDGRVVLATKANVGDFLRMLDDGFLVSPLSNAHYEARSKKRVDRTGDA